MKIFNVIFSAAMLFACRLVAADCLKPIENWQLCSFKDATTTSYSVNKTWNVSATRIPAQDDGDDTYQIRVTNTTGVWTGYSQSDYPFFVGQFGAGQGRLVVMHVLEIRNGLGIIEWQLDVLTNKKNGITVTASADLEDGGYDSIFCGRGHELGFLKTGWAKRPVGVTEGDWYSGEIVWLRDGGFTPDAKATVKYKRLYSKFMKERTSDLGTGVVGRPSKWLGISNWWCK